MASSSFSCTVAVWEVRGSVPAARVRMCWTTSWTQLDLSDLYLTLFGRDLQLLFPFFQCDQSERCWFAWCYLNCRWQIQFMHQWPAWPFPPEPLLSLTLLGATFFRSLYALNNIREENNFCFFCSIMERRNLFKLWPFMWSIHLLVPLLWSYSARLACSHWGCLL